MSYAGICGAEDLHSESHFGLHGHSISTINSFTNALGGQCDGLIATNNADPGISPVADITIPANTPFRLDASVADLDSANLLFAWHQVDPGDSMGATDSARFGTDTGNNPLFRSFEPQPDSWRDFPALGTQLRNQTDAAEVIPSRTRTLNFRMVAFDDEYGQDQEDVAVTVSSSPGFRITSHDSGGSLDTTSSYQVTWDTANTDVAPINCTKVDVELIAFSSGHTTHSRHMLAPDIDNMGCVDITAPLAESNPRARIQVSCRNNIFYDISNNDLNVLGSNSAQLDDNDYDTFYYNNGSTHSGRISQAHDDSLAEKDYREAAMPACATYSSDSDGGSGDGGGDNEDDNQVGAFSPFGLISLSSLLALLQGRRQTVRLRQVAQRSSLATKSYQNLASGVVRRVCTFEFI